MAIDLCIESAGWVAQFVEVSVVHPLLPLRRPVSLPGQRSNVERSSVEHPGVAHSSVQLEDEVVREAASGLPIHQAEAIWLIDVCGSSYDGAATSIGIDRHEFAGRIADARRAIRNSVSAKTN